MLVLALDTATSGCAVALVNDGETLARRAKQMPRGQSEALMPMVLDAVAAAGRKLADVDLFAVTAGPGGFTGLRIGLAAARGMALAADKPCLGITTFDALAHAVSTKKMILAVVESKRKDAFLQLYASDHTPVGAPVTLVPDDLPAWLDKQQIGPQGMVVTGDAVAKFAGNLQKWADTHGCPVDICDTVVLPDPAVIARIAVGVFNDTGTDALQSHPARPVYLRGADVSKPKKKSLPVTG